MRVVSYTSGISPVKSEAAVSLSVPEILLLQLV